MSRTAADEGAAPDKRPRVTQVITSLNLGGAEEIALSLIEQLHLDCDFSVFAVMGVAQTDIGLDMQRRLQELNVPLFCGTTLDMKAGGAVHAGHRLRRLLTQLRPSVLHLHTDIPDSTYAASTLFGSDAPETRVVRTIHNTTLWPKWKRIGGWVERKLERAQVVAVSPASLDGLQAFRRQQGLSALPAEQCQVVYNGVPLREDARESFITRRPGPVRVLFAGRFEVQKGADLLPAIFECASRLTGTEVEVQLYGHGSLGPSLERWAADNPLPWPVTVSGPVPRLASRLGDYDVVFMPSRFEGLALLCIEAAMMGVPVVGTNIAGLRELFPPGSALLAESQDIQGLARRLVQVIEAPGEYRARALSQVPLTEAKFGAPRMAEAYRQVYRHASPSPISSSPASSSSGPPGFVAVQDPR